MQNAQEFYTSTIDDAQLNGSTITAANTFNVNEMAIINSGKSTDLAKMLTRPGFNAGSTISLSGGNANTTYRISGGYIQDDGMIANTTYKKYNINAAVDLKSLSF